MINLAGLKELENIKVKRVVEDGKYTAILSDCVLKQSDMAGRYAILTFTLTNETNTEYTFTLTKFLFDSTREKNFNTFEQFLGHYEKATDNKFETALDAVKEMSKTKFTIWIKTNDYITKDGELRSSKDIWFTEPVDKDAGQITMDNLLADED